jgi:hypothetical protein
MILGFIVLIGAILRVWPSLIDRPIWIDEAFTWKVANDSTVLNILKGKAHPDHPGLSYLLVRHLAGTFWNQQHLATETSLFNL